MNRRKFITLLGGAAAIVAARGACAAAADAGGWGALRRVGGGMDATNGRVPPGLSMGVRRGAQRRDQISLGRGSIRSDGRHVGPVELFLHYSPPRPPAFRKRRHRGLARRLVAVRRRAIFMDARKRVSTSTPHRAQPQRTVTETRR